MYHYVREFREDLPNFRYLDFKSFKNQLNFFGEKYGFVKKDEWLNFVEKGELPKIKGKIILTFDDGLRDHYDFVFNELKSRGLWGIFYINSFPYRKREILDVHKVHLLCSLYDGKDLLDFLTSCITESMLKNKSSYTYEGLKSIYANQINLHEITKFKKILNYFLEDQYKAKVINKLCKNFPIGLEFKDFYLSKNQIIEMQNNEMIIGAHSKSHHLMSKLDYNVQFNEICDSFKFLESICNLIHKTYCHPFGGKTSYNQDTISILEKESIDYSFSVESREINKQDFKTNRHSLPRFDCNEFPHGKIS